MNYFGHRSLFKRARILLKIRHPAITFLYQNIGILHQQRILLDILLMLEQKNTNLLQTTSTRHYHRIKLFKLNEYKTDVSAADDILIYIFRILSPFETSSPRKEAVITSEYWNQKKFYSYALSQGVQIIHKKAYDSIYVY